MLVSVCICTHRRAGLAQTLDSIEAQVLPDGVTLEVVVVDNDAEGSARSIVGQYQRVASHLVRYDIEPQRGLSTVRNRTLLMAKGQWLAMIDDDEVAAPDWIACHLKIASAYAADAVIGSQLSVFEGEPPSWITSSGFFELTLPPTGSLVHMGDTTSGNALVNAAFLAKHKIIFDTAFNRTSSEDTDFFNRIILANGRIVSCKEARVYESVPNERLSVDYMKKRSLRIGEGYAVVRHKQGASTLYILARATINVLGATAIMLALLPFGRDYYYRYYIYALRNVGKLRYHLGFKPIEMYG